MTTEQSPLVSIAVPAYRPGAVFRDTLRSCLAQDWPNLEVVVTLDGEDEAVEAAVAEAGDARVRLVHNGVRLGQFSNFNRAVHECRGEYVKLLCADDLMGRDAVRLMVEALQASPEVGLATALMLAFWSDASLRIEPRVAVPVLSSPPVQALGPAEGRWFTALHGNMVGGPSNVMFRRDAWWRSGGFDPRMDHCGEQGLWYRMIARGGLVLVNRPVIGYRNHVNSVTGRGALTFDRVEQPFMMAETATLGAAFPNELWRERVVRMLQTVNSTAGYAASMVRREPLRGWRAVWRVVTAAGVLASPLAAGLALWAVLRSSVLGLRTQWPFSSPVTERVVPTGPLDTASLVDLLSEPGARVRLLGGGRT